MNTKGALKKVIPAAKNEIIEQIDEEIRRYIASIEGNIFLPTTDFIKKRIEIYYSLSPNNLEKKCKKVAKIYLKNEREWMTQENIFCFLALLYTSISLMVRVVQEIIEFSTKVSDVIQILLLLIVLVAFVVLCKGGYIYDNIQFARFLNEFNRKAPSITIIVPLFFYIVMVLMPSQLEIIKNIILLICAGLMLLPIIWAYTRVKKCKNKRNQQKFIVKISYKFKKVLEATKKKFYYIKNKRVLHKIYEIMSVISTLTIFTGMIYFVMGKITNNNQSDNDLIMLQIKEVAENQEIINIETVDVHGFGNDSIIVTTSNNGWDGDDNKLIILESVENEVLHSMNDLFGLKSSYKTTFIYRLKSEKMHLYPVINSVSDIIGDSTKEILIDYYVWGSTYGAYYTAIFKYSYENEKYEWIGSYPMVYKQVVSKYDEEGNIVSTTAQDVDVEFDNLSCESKGVSEFSDYEKSFYMTLYSDFCRDYWAEFSNLGKAMVAVKREKWREEAIINVYYPLYDEVEGRLIWRVVYSEKTAELSDNYTKDELAKWMEKKFNCIVNMY